MISTTSLFITVSSKVVRVHFLLKLKNHIATPFQSVTRTRHRFPSPDFFPPGSVARRTEA